MASAYVELLPAQRARAQQLLAHFDLIDPQRLTLREEIAYYGCPFCDLDEGRLSDTLFGRAAEFCRYKECARCGLHYAYPRLSAEGLRAWSVGAVQRDMSTVSLRLGRVERAPVRANRLLSALMPTDYDLICRSVRGGERVLDMGAGYGHVSHRLKQQGCDVTAVEHNLARVRYLREECGIAVIDQSIEQAEFPSGAFDVVIFSRVLIHLFSVRRALEQASTALKPGGRLIVSVTSSEAVSAASLRRPHWGNIGLDGFSLPTMFTAPSLRYVLRESGFDVTRLFHARDPLVHELFANAPAHWGWAARTLFTGAACALELLTVLKRQTSYLVGTAVKRG